jgi:cytoskeletal protein CcmA (bactofilin family)
MRKKYKFDGKVSTIICKGAILGGDFNAPDSARIDGEVKGNVKVKGLLILGEKSVVNGDVEAEAAMVAGNVTGNITAKGKIQLMETAKVNGDIKTEILVVDEHAVFNGNCEMTGKGKTEEKKEEPKEESKEESKEEKKED